MNPASAFETQRFRQSLDQTVGRYAMLSHPFYQDWTAGRLTKDILARYATQYYAHVANFPRYVSAVHANCDDIRVRQMLLENLIEEERGPENHPELWLRFAEGLGLGRDEVRSGELLASTVESVAEITRATREMPYPAGVAALYAYESQIPDVARSKREGLKEFYGIEDERSVAFFRVHETADVDHSRMELGILERRCLDETDRRDALAGAETAARALWHFLDGVQAAYC